MRRALWIAGILAVFASPVVADSFDAYWHDGKAELDGYRLKISRYGEERDGQAVMVFVTEPFSKSKLVKVNDHRENPDDVIDVLKLNFVRDFSTGIYDYNTMVSVFVRTNDLEPVKVSFSSAEWCGHVYSEMRFDKDRIRGNYLSYFEDESGPFEVQRPRGALVEDNLFILLRGLREPFLAAGTSKTVDLLPGVLVRRFLHKEAHYVSATISRRAANEDVSVPAGRYSCIVYDVSVGDRNGEFCVDAEYPHRIVRWSLAPDVTGELTGSTRLEYWRLHANGDEKYLEQIGLKTP